MEQATQMADEKSDKSRSSNEPNTIEDGKNSPTQNDVEEPQEAPPDPNVVDWESPDDPANPR